MKQKLHDLMLKILPFEEFRQNDVVREAEVYPCLIDKNDNPVIKYRDGIVFSVSANWICVKNYTDSAQFRKKDTKFISRDWQLPDLLMAMNKNKKELLWISSDGLLWVTDLTHYPHTKEIPYDLTKSVLDQESIKEIINIITGE